MQDKNRQIRHRNDISKKGTTKPTYAQKKYLRQKQVRRTYLLIAAGVIAVIAAICFFVFRGRNSVLDNQITENVTRYREQVEKYCKEYKISDFTEVVMAMMMQESAGLVSDVLQCSESPFNTKYSKEPGSIDDPDYSIQVGVETFAYCLDQAGCTSVDDMDKLKLALQEYNFGNDYVVWATENYGGYTQENALEFSEKMKKELGWSAYGDPLYVSHVLRYYNQEEK